MVTPFVAQYDHGRDRVVQVFTQAFIMTKGGPNYATLFYVLYLYQQAFEWFNLSYASALGCCL